MRIVTFGEIMLRLSPEGYDRFFQNDRLRCSFGGAEANVALSLAQLGMDAAFVTRLPDQAVGHAAIRTLRAFGVDTSGILLGGDRLGIYYQEKGSGVRPYACVYDRAHSAIAEASSDMFDWEKLLSGADIFHFTGITPALSPALAEACLAACTTARRLGVTVSCDLNYREKLWDLPTARRVMERLCPLVDICIANEGEVADLFLIRPDSSAPDGRADVAKKACARFGFEKIALTLFTPFTASEDEWSGLLYDATSGEPAYAPTYHLPMVDRVGIGDAFAAGLLWALSAGESTQEAIDFATAASAVKHAVEGDFNRATVDEIRRVAETARWNGTR